MTQISIKYFASVREALGSSGEQLQTTASTVAALRDELIARGGAFAQTLARGQALRIALNHTMTEEDAALTEGCEVAFFPPVTGG
ncbi:molybdopterin converting factor subunit 1 [Variovorax sp. PCZ-1]|uniref:molybdopterin converting factor subunit 1 n=1 Tax=Variovorax sp. PCZ-1 TaxID=2835533 RepID=UPI001BCAD0E0|nr:molybdopterin converting factor subunit 1 [Variovorax sp. PCZ-1]MBS7807081.1 molybdopterin converting factor subunit 1 [Variovorax sp. PCZ-1]